MSQAAQNAKATIKQLPEFSKFASQEARLWENYGKVRIYFGRQHIEFYNDGTCDLGSNPYGIGELVSEICETR